MQTLPYLLMAKKKISQKEFDKALSEPVPDGEWVVGLPKEPTELEKIEAELRDLSPTLSGLKRNDPARYKQVYKRYMWLVGERDRLTNG